MAAPGSPCFNPNLAPCGAAVARSRTGLRALLTPSSTSFLTCPSWGRTPPPRAVATGGPGSLGINDDDHPEKGHVVGLVVTERKIRHEVPKKPQNKNFEQLHTHFGPPCLIESLFNWCVPSLANNERLKSTGDMLLPIPPSIPFV